MAPKVQAKRVVTSRTRETEADTDTSKLAVASLMDAETEAANASAHPPEIVEPVEDGDENLLRDDPVDFYDEELAVDIETLENSGPGQFVIRRNQELLSSLSVISGEVSSIRRMVELGTETSADRLVRAIDRAEASAAKRARGMRRIPGRDCVRQSGTGCTGGLCPLALALCGRVGCTGLRLTTLSGGASNVMQDVRTTA